MDRQQDWVNCLNLTEQINELSYIYEYITR